MSWIDQSLFLSVLLITGAWNGGSAEIFNPVDRASCKLPDLPEPRYTHTSNNGILCGGATDSTKSNCIKFSEGNWITSHNLGQGRRSHTSWEHDKGESFMLMGGYYSLKTTEIVHIKTGKVVDGYELHYDTA